MSPGRRREMVNREHSSLPIVRQCTLLGVSRSSLYYRPRAVSGDDLFLMRAIDGQYLETPFYGSRRIRVWLERQGMVVSRKRVQRLMRIMGLRAIYCQPRTSRPAPEHRVYPYLLRVAEITRTNQVWAADITYLPMARGFLYLVPIMDWYSRYVVAWRLSNTLEAEFCVEALQEALGQGRPQVFNTGQGSLFTRGEFILTPQEHRVKISMDGKGRYQGNIFVERLVADGEVRGGLPESLRQRRRGPTGTGSLLPVLQQPETPSGCGLPDPCRGVPRIRQCPGGGIEDRGRSTGTGVSIIGRSSGTLA